MNDEPVLTQRRRRPDRLKPWLARLAVVLACGLVLLGAFVLSRAAVAADQREAAAEAQPPLLVEVRPARVVDGYDVRRDFVGRVEASRSARAAFELQGLVVEVLADDGDPVAAGEPLARLDVSRLDAQLGELEARVVSAEADLELAERTLVRTREAAVLEAVSAQDLDDAEQRAASARAAVEVARAARRAVEVDLAKATLVAPFDAVVTRRAVDEGDVVSPGTVAFELLDRRRPEARIGLAGPAVEAIGVGDRRTVRVAGGEVAATVASILPSRDGRARTVEAVLVLDAELDGIRRGDLVTLGVDRRVEAKGVRLPTDALAGGARGMLACFVAVPLDDADGEATHRLSRLDAQVLHQDGAGAVVAAAIAEGDLVVVSGVHKLAPGLMVRVSRGAGR